MLHLLIRIQLTNVLYLSWKYRYLEYATVVPEKLRLAVFLSRLGKVHSTLYAEMLIRVRSMLRNYKGKGVQVFVRSAFMNCAQQRRKGVRVTVQVQTAGGAREQHLTRNCA
jgi:hypothetical protein